MKSYYIFILLILFSPGFSWSTPGTVSIMNWPEGKTSAYAVTFDDGYRNNYLLAAPLLEKHGFRGTFYLNGGWMDAGWTMSWDDASDLISRGHEIGNHSLNHPNLDTLPIGDDSTPNTGIFEIVESWKKITDKVINGSIQNGMSFAFPYGNPKIPELTEAIMEHHVSARNSSGHVNLSDVESLMSLRSEVPKFPDPRNPETDMNEILKIQNDISTRVINKNRFGILLLHNVQSNYDDVGGLTISESLLDSFLGWLSERSQNDNLWVDSVNNISRYIREREAFSYTVQSDHEQFLEILPQDELEDSVFNYPLTAQITVPESWSTSATVRQGMRTSIHPIQSSSGEQFIVTTIDPAGGTLTITGQTDESWAGFPVSSDGIVDTGSFLGYLEIRESPWIWSYSLNKYAYIRPDTVDALGAWIFLP